jgi:MFS family permease
MFMPQFHRLWNEFNSDLRLLFLTTALAAMGMSVTDLLTNLYLLRTGFGERTVGTLVAVNATMMAVGALPLGVLVDRYSRRTALWLGLAMAGTGTAAMALAPVLPVLYAAATLGGLSGALLTVATPAYIAGHTEPGGRAWAFTVMAMIHLVAMTLGQLGGGLLPGLLGGGTTAYRLALLLGSALILMASVRRLALRDAPCPRWSQVRPAFRLAVLRAPILHSAGSNLLLGVGAGLFIPFFNVVYRVRYDLEPAQIGLIFAVQHMLMVVAVMLAPVLSRRRGTVNTIASAWTVSVVFLFVLAWAPDPRWFTAGFWIRGTLMFAIGPLLDSFRQDLMNDGERATASSIIGMTWFAGWAIGSAAGGDLLARGLYSAPFLVASFFYLVSAGWFFTVFRRIQAEPAIRPEFGVAVRNAGIDGPAPS